MKIRNGHVSNSSSSSFLIVYDESFFGDLKRFFERAEIGFNTRVCRDENEMRKMMKDCEFSEETLKNIEEELSKAAEEKRKTVCGQLDQEHLSIFELLFQIDMANHGGHLKVLIYPEGN